MPSGVAYAKLVPLRGGSYWEADVGGRYLYERIHLLRN